MDDLFHIGIGRPAPGKRPVALDVASTASAFFAAFDTDKPQSELPRDLPPGRSDLAGATVLPGTASGPRPGDALAQGRIAGADFGARSAASQEAVGPVSAITAVPHQVRFTPAPEERRAAIAVASQSAGGALATDTRTEIATAFPGETTTPGHSPEHAPDGVPVPRSPALVPPQVPPVVHGTAGKNGPGAVAQVATAVPMRSRSASAGGVDPVAPLGPVQGTASQAARAPVAPGSLEPAVAVSSAAPSGPYVGKVSASASGYEASGAGVPLEIAALGEVRAGETQTEMSVPGMPRAPDVPTVRGHDGAQAFVSAPVPGVAGPEVEHVGEARRPGGGASRDAAVAPTAGPLPSPVSASGHGRAGPDPMPIPRETVGPPVLHALAIGWSGDPQALPPGRAGQKDLDEGPVRAAGVDPRLGWGPAVPDRGEGEGHRPTAMERPSPRYAPGSGHGAVPLPPQAADNRSEKPPARDALPPLALRTPPGPAPTRPVGPALGLDAEPAPARPIPAPGGNLQAAVAARVALIVPAGPASGTPGDLVRQTDLPRGRTATPTPASGDTLAQAASPVLFGTPGAMPVVAPTAENAPFPAMSAMPSGGLPAADITASAGPALASKNGPVVEVAAPPVAETAPRVPIETIPTPEPDAFGGVEARATGPTQAAGSAPVPPSADLARAASRQLAQAMADRADRGGGFDVALDPPELGRVRLSFAEAGGALTLSITADRPETADLMRRHLSLLTQEFQKAGLDAPSVDISDRRGGGRQDPRPNEGETVVAGSATSRAAMGDPRPASRTGASDGLDLRL